MAVVLSGERTHALSWRFSRCRPRPTRLVSPRLLSRQSRLPDDGLDFEQTVSHIERSILEQALRKTSGNKKMAADMLRLKRTTLSAKLLAAWMRRGARSLRKIPGTDEAGP